MKKERERIYETQKILHAVFVFVVDVDNLQLSYGIREWNIRVFENFKRAGLPREFDCTVNF